MIDAEKFLYNFTSIIEKSPLQTYGAGLVFCGANSDIRHRFWDRRLAGIKNVFGTGDNESSFIQALKHDGQVVAVAFSPDGQHLATASTDKTARLWNPVTGKCIHLLDGHSDAVSTISFSPDGRLLATGSGTMVRIWDTATGIRKSTLEGHSQDIHNIAFSQDGELLVSASSEGKVCLWHPATGTLKKELDGKFFAISPSNEFVAIATERSVSLWNTAKGTINHKLEDQDNETVLSMAFSPDSQVLAIASRQRTWRSIRLWDVTTGTCKQTHTVGYLDIGQLSFSPDGAFIGVGLHSSVALMDVAKGSIKTLSHAREGDGMVSSLAFSPNGKLLAATRTWSSRIELFDMTSRGRASESLGVHTARVRGVAFSDSNLLASASDDGTAGIWHTSVGSSPSTWESLRGMVTGSNNRMLDKCNHAKAVMFSPDGSLLATIAYYGCTVSIWDTATGAHKHTFSLLFPDDSITFSPDNESLVVFFRKRRVLEVHNIETNARKAVVDGYRQHLIPDPVELIKENVVWGIAAFGMGYVWDAASVAACKDLGRTFSHIIAFSFSHDGKQLALASDTWIRLYDTVKNRYIWKLDDYQGPAVRAIAFSPGKDCIVMALDDGTMQLWDTELRGRKQILHGHPDSVVAVAISPNKDTIASASADGSLWLWDTATGGRKATTDLSRYCLHTRELRFSDDGRYLKTDEGWVSLSPETSSGANAVRENPGDSVSINEDWLSWEGSNFLWLPPDYRAVDADFSNNAVVMLHPSWKVTLIEFEYV